ncbi:hypothetical protein NEOLEDRAFT_369327 [Neolentinus lepideus HHB14362 ss-1]|uniref:Uncharacterized protein n=1 Tax=Neolentinus lepideus HHB14362 ss-1 TaxID=1314782 RepID=A0A165SHD0_9AGAM|nr:hypothetical protein NEOLEDRAFT_369327 [Neolentinus lepideus HHB14362 ss-1]
MLSLLDPAVLWRKFDHMHNQHMIGFPTLGAFIGSREICTCIIYISSLSPPPCSATSSFLIQISLHSHSRLQRNAHRELHAFTNFLASRAPSVAPARMEGNRHRFSGAAVTRRPWPVLDSVKVRS